MTGILREHISTIVNKSQGTSLNSGIEVEARFGRYSASIDRPTFNSNIGRAGVFYQALKYIKTLGNVKTTKYIDRRWTDGTRHRYNETENTHEWIKKNRIYDVEIYDYDMRVSISKEEPTAVYNGQPNDVIRSTTRYTVVVGDFTFDVSRVSTKYVNPKKPKRDDTLTFEFEIEVNSGVNINGDTLSLLDEQLVLAFKAIKDTTFLYTVNEIYSVNYMINQAMGKGIVPNEYKNNDRGNIEPQYQFIFRQNFNDARNLRRYDMVDGGLVGKKGQFYKVTDKADGKRKLLCFNNVGAWIVYADSYNLIWREDFSAWKDYIFEGEYIQPENRLKRDDGQYIDPNHDPITGATHVMYLYDAISNKAQGHYLQDESHTIRMDVVINFIDALPSNSIPNLYVQPKDFLTLTYDIMYERISWMLNTTRPYKRDGLMFIPDMSPYDLWRDYKHNMMDLNDRNSKTNKPAIALLPPLNKRNLYDENSNDICKWKPATHLTIDLRVVFDDAKGLVELWTDNIRTDVKFFGSKRYPIRVNGIDDPNDPLNWKAGLDPNDVGLYPHGIRVENNTIIECMYMGASDTASETDVTLKYQLKAVGVRDDKVRPNQQDVCIDTWDLAHEPLPEHTMRGNGTILMRFYHNDIKRDLYAKMTKGATILDIGSGRGGDISKWRDLNYIFAVEPNEEWIGMFRERLAMPSNAGMRNKVEIIPTGAEDVDRIINTVRTKAGKVDYITFMLSMTFFWQSEIMLRNIAYLIQETLKPNGKVIFITMDGDVVSNYFRPTLFPPGPSSPSGTEPAPIRKFETEYIQFYPKDDKYFINIKDTKVCNQIEYAAHVNDLAILLGGTLRKIRADKRRILNPEEKMLSNMYSYGEITLDEKNLPSITKPERAINMIPVAPTSRPVSGENCNLNNPSSCGSIGLCGLPNIKFAPTGASQTITGSTRPLRISLTTDNKIERVPYIVSNGIPMYVYRLYTIGDGSCFVHAFMQGFSGRYNGVARPRTERERQMLAYYLRYDLATYLTNGNTNTGISNYILYDEGKFPVAFTNQLASAQISCDKRGEDPNSPSPTDINPETGMPYKDMRVFKYGPVDNSYTGIINLFKARGAYLGTEAWDIFSDLIGVDAYIFEVREDKFVFKYTTAVDGRPRRAVIIGGVRSSNETDKVDHFETIGVEGTEADGITPRLITIFEYDSPIFTGINRRDASRNISDADATGRFVSTGYAEMKQTMRTLIEAGSSLSVFIAHRPLFSKHYDQFITKIINDLGVSQDIWPKDKANARLITKSDFPLCFESQNNMRLKLGYPTYTNVPPPIITPTVPSLVPPSMGGNLPSIFLSPLPSGPSITIAPPQSQQPQPIPSIIPSIPLYK